MDSTTTALDLRQIPVLIRGETDPICRWVERWDGRRVALHLAVIVLGTGLYGAAMGWWRAPLQALFTAIKFPLIILLTTLGNGLLNAMLAPLLGLDLRFRQSLLVILASFTIASVILGSFSPLLAFLVWNAPPLSAGAALDNGVYRFIQLTQVAVIAFAGVAANVRLGQLLSRLGGSARAGRRVLWAWLAMNLLLGSQITWILRPFIGAPFLPVQFLRPNALEGNFFETVLAALGELLFFD